MFFDSATARVPATTANLGPGFDCMGAALDMHLTVTLRRDSTASVQARGEGAGSVPTDESNLVYRAAAAFYERTGAPAPPMHVCCVNRIPLSRGLGSSAAAIVGGFGAANALEGSPLTQEQVFQACAEIEGHPDNVAPALLGGFQVVAREDGAFVHGAIKPKRGLKAVVFIPTHEVVTKEARAVLPKDVAREDAVYNVSRASLLTLALSQGRWDLLEAATQDRLHQPYRAPLVPGAERLFEAALDAGAHGAFLSGSGPSVLALVSGDSSPVVRALTSAANRAGTPGMCVVARVGAPGARITARPAER